MAVFSWLFGSKAATETSATQTGTDRQLQRAPDAAATQPSPSSAISSLAGHAGQAAGVQPLDVPSSRAPLFSQRSLKQLGFFFAGAGFLSTSILLSRRAAIRHHAGAQLKYYIPNYRSLKKGDQTEQRDPMVAVEALNLATLNVLGFAIMAAGGASWAFDISTLDELRAKARRTLYGPGAATDEEAEKEVAEWVAKTLGKSVDLGDGNKAADPKKGSSS